MEFCVVCIVGYEYLLVEYFMNINEVVKITPQM